MGQRKLENLVFGVVERVMGSCNMIERQSYNLALISKSIVIPASSNKQRIVRTSFLEFLSLGISLFEKSFVSFNLLIVFT